MSIQNCKFVSLPQLIDDRGALSFAEGNNHVPFAIKRIFYLYDVPPAKSRGAHAHKELQQFIISFGGTLEITLDDGREKKQITLKKPNEGLYIPPMIWTSVDNFSPNAVCLVLASDLYDEADYYRSYPEFLQALA